MTLDGRVWQFLFGFLAHFVYKAKLLDWTNKKKGQTIGYKLIIWIRNSIPIFLLVLLLAFPLINVMEQQIQRFLVVFLTALIIAIRQEDSILSWDTLVNLGDVSYSGKNVICGRKMVHSSNKKFDWPPAIQIFALMDQAVFCLKRVPFSPHCAL
jgi:hypothetical protein